MPVQAGMCRSCCFWRWWKGIGGSGFPGWDGSMSSSRTALWSFPTPQLRAGWKQIHPSLKQPVWPAWGSGLQDMGSDAPLCIVCGALPPASPLPPPSSGCLCQSSALGRDQSSSHRAIEMSGWRGQSWATVLTSCCCVCSWGQCPVLWHGDVAPC